jgi:hypothetical protein
MILLESIFLMCGINFKAELIYGSKFIINSCDIKSCGETFL